MKSVMITLLLAVVLALVPTTSYGQVVQPGKIVASTAGCATSAQSTGGTAYITENPQGQECVVVSATTNTSGLTVTDTVTTVSSAAAVNLDTSPGQIYGLTVTAGLNTSGTHVWMNFFNAVTGNVTPGTTSALFSLELIGTTQGPYTPIPWTAPIGIPFSTALSVNCTTTKNGATSTTTPCNVILVRK